MTDTHPKTTTFRAEAPIAIIGAGVMGAKVGWACSRRGLQTRLFDIQEGKAEKAIQLAQKWGTPLDAISVAENLVTSPCIEHAVRDVQLVFESVPESLSLKQRVLSEIGSIAPAMAYLGSNTSSIMCAPLAAASGRDGQFFNMNFTDPRASRLVELMGCQSTKAGTLQFAMEWARHIGMVPVVTRKDQIGYSFNRLWRAIKREVLRQLDEDSVSVEDIDRAWMLSFGTEFGPCGMMDEIGLHSVLAIEKLYYENVEGGVGGPPLFLEKMVSRGETGVSGGRGFYSYPDPEYSRRDFLEGSDGPSMDKEVCDRWGLE